MEPKSTEDSKSQNPVDNQESPAPNTPEIETIESWTFLGDESTSIQSTRIGDAIHQHEENTKASPKTSRSSSSCLSENLLSVTNHTIDGDISDGISVISDCDSHGRHSPMPLRNKSCLDDTDHSFDELQNASVTSRIEDIDQYTLVEKSDKHELKVLISSNDQRHFQWNPTNIILFGLIIGGAAILSSRCWGGMNSSHESLIPQMTSLDKRIKDLESENFALKVEVNRLVELYHAGRDHPHGNEKVNEKRPVKIKKVWTGEDETPIRIPKYPAKDDYCNDEYLKSDDLFASYNAKKCENVKENVNDDFEEQQERRTKSKDKFRNEQVKSAGDDFQQSEGRKKKNFTKDDTASHKRQKFRESKDTNVESDYGLNSDEIVRNEKFVKFQEDRQKLYDEAKQKYLEKQEKFEKKQEKDKTHREALRDQNNNSQKQSKDVDSDWYDKMMKQREELRAKGSNGGSTKQQNKENWYIERANEREKVRGKHEKQAKAKQYR